MNLIKKTGFRLALLLITMWLCSPAEASSGRGPEIKNLQIAPNPFSPYSVYSSPYNDTEPEQGLRIRFEVETLSRFFWYTIRVHNLYGNVVRTIVELTPDYTQYDKQEPAEIIVWWDGKDDSGRYANNGRYLIHIKVSDTEAEDFSTHKIKPVVLIK